MKKHLLTFLFACLLTLGSLVQAGSDFFFEYKKSDLTAEHKTKLDEIIAGINKDSTLVRISSYCDSVGGVDYNVGLGQQRADQFINYFTSAGVPRDNIAAVNNGSTSPLESNATEEGRAQNRRVIVEVMGGSMTAAPDSAVQDTAEERVIDALPCDEEVMVELTGGSILRMNKCEYEKYNSCFTIMVYTSPEKLKASNFNTMRFGGKPLATAGIVEVKLCNDSALKNNLTVFVPADNKCKFNGTADLYTNFGKGVWNDRVTKAKLDTLDGKLYYSFTTKKSGEATFAKLVENASEVKIKSKKGLKMKSIRAYYSCEMGIYHTDLEEPAKKAKVLLPCPNSVVRFDIVAEDKEGNEVKFENISSGDIKSKGKQKGCDNDDAPKCFYVYPETK